MDLDTATTLIVKRAWDGSVLAAHSASADVYGKTGIEICPGAARLHAGRPYDF